MLEIIISVALYAAAIVMKREFGADMKVALVNDGPVTICIDTKNKGPFAHRN